jgi:two-component system chemotaxis sensor kinase CheA
MRRTCTKREALIARVHAVMIETAEAGSFTLEALTSALSPVASASGPEEPIQSREETPVVASPAITGSKASEMKSAEAKPVESRTVKVDTTKLDFLVDMVGELVIAQSMIRHHGDLTSVTNPQLQRNLAQLSRITGEVQKTAMSMRMVPVGQLFQKSVRLVRDLTRKSGKRAEVEIVGEDTELDRTIVDDLSDPLMHMIRNAADHGIEGPEDRVHAGKNPVARISLKAYHQAGHIVIEIADDGRGLMRDKILKKAKERGLIQDGTNLQDKEVFNLIFEPGFSTAEKITDVSGRGVGMDVVRKQIQKMRGRVDIESQPGVGTTFLLKLPLTLAIIDGLVVGVGNERYIVPIFAVREIFKPQPETVFTVENRHEMVLVRGNLLPIVRLYKRFGVAARSQEITESVLVVAESGGRRFCLVVDELIGKQQVVIKSLGEVFKGVAGVAGGAILGDGRVGLIVDMEGVFAEPANAA